MATHCSVLAWRIPGKGEPGRLPSMGSQSWTRLKRLSSSSSSSDWRELVHIYLFFQAFSRIILRLPFQWFFRKSHWDSVCSQWWFAGEFTPFIASLPFPISLPQKLNFKEFLHPWIWLLLLSRFSRVQLCDPIDGSPPGSPFPRILQARTLEWVAISFSNSWKWKVKVKSLSRVWLFATPWTAAYQAPLSMGFSRQEYWSGVPLPSPKRLSKHVI